MLTLLLLALFGIQDPELDALLKQLSSPSGEEQHKAVDSLVELGDRVEARVKELKSKATGSSRSYCDQVLRRLDSKRKFHLAIPPLKRVSLDVQARPLRTILDSFKNQAGWIFTERVFDYLEVPVTVNVKNATPLEALDAICRSLGADFELDTGWRPTFEGEQVYPPLPIVMIRGAAGRPRAPQAFIRNYRVVASHLRLTRENRFTEEGKGCQIGIKVQWNPDFMPDSISYQPISVVDDQGRSLFDPKPYAYNAFKAEQKQRDFNLDGQRLDSSWRGWDIRYPQPDAKSIASFKGRVHVTVRADKKYVEFKEPEKNVGKVEKYEGVSIRLKECRKEGGRLSVIVQAYRDRLQGQDYTRPHGDLLIGFEDIELRTGPSDVLLNRSEDFEQSGESIEGYPTTINTFRLLYRDTAASAKSVRVLMDATNVVDSFDFELKDLPLPK